MGVKDNYIYEKCMDALDATFREERQRQELSILEKMAPVGPKEKKLLKEMIEEVWSDERLDALHQVNMADTKETNEKNN